MSKTRFSSSDVKAMVRDIRSSILGQRLANIYDLNDNKTYIFKFNSINTLTSNELEHQNQKFFLLCESGTRFHCTKYVHDKKDLPNPFTMKLRRFIRLKRLEDIKQLNFDRVVDLKFGTGDIAYHVILELYSQGNIILTDANYEIINLLHSHEFETDVAIKVGEIYPMVYTTTSVMSTLSSSQSSTDEIDILINTCLHIENELNESSTNTKNSKKTTIKNVLLNRSSPHSVYGPEIIEHCLLQAGISPSSKLNTLTCDRSIFDRLILSLKTADSILAQLNTPNKGYVIYRDSAMNTDGTTYQELIEFVPILFAQHSDKNHIEFDSFAEAVDHFFCNIEDQRLSRQAKAAEDTALKKIHKVTSEQHSLIESLSKAQIDLEEKATLVELFADDVEKVCLVINSALSSGMSWDDIADMVVAETKRGNAVASLVNSLKLDKNIVTLKLDDPFYDEEESSGSRSKLVDIDLSLSAFANARLLYGNRKTAKIKEQKTIQNSVKVIQSVEASAMKSLEAQKIKKNLNAIRHVYWFERFNWCISSEGYLILAGRDAQQNEQLVKRYLRPGDAYVHADLSGAASCIVRCKGDAGDSSIMKISPIALDEAGALTVCRSGAWDAKALIAAYWVHQNQVSKTAPSGEYLSTGSFMIYGKKNYLSPMALEMGFGILFRLDDNCVASHLGERKDKVHFSFVNTEDDMNSDDRHLSKYKRAEKRSAILEDDNDDASLSISQMSSEIIPEFDFEKNNIEDDSDIIDASAENEEAVHEDSENSDDCSENDELVEEHEMKEPESDDVLSESVDQKPEGQKNKYKYNTTSGSSKLSETCVYVKKKKNITKKKAKRYSEQDDEDRQLAMLTLGHLKFGEEKKQIDLKRDEEMRKQNTLKKQEKLGIKTSKIEWSSLVANFGPKTTEALNDLIKAGKIAAGEIDESELRAIGAFADDDGETVLNLFRDGNFSHQIGNKSGFLAGIIRRYAKDKAVIKPSDASLDAVRGESVSGVQSLSRREKKRIDEREIQAIIDDEGIAEEEAGANADELDKLTGAPRSDDILLYAVPMCGPYSSFANFKFKVKLTPGTQKKGKAAKQSIEVFLKNKDLSAYEKSAIKALSDPEMVAIMIGDVKLSTPGLQQVQKTQRGQKKSGGIKEH